MSDALTSFTKLPGFAGLDAELRQDLVSASRVLHLARGQWLFDEGNVIGYPALILSGTAGIYRSLTSHSVLIGIIGPGVSIGQLLATDGQLPYSAICRTDVLLAQLPPLAALDEEGRNARIAYFLLTLQARQWGITLQRTADRLSLPPLARVAAELLYLRDQFGSGMIDVTQEELAEMIGVSRKTINKCVGKLSRVGLIQPRYASLEIRDARALSLIAADH